MNNHIYEQIYSKIVEPIYGEKRDAVQDKEFELQRSDGCSAPFELQRSDGCSAPFESCVGHHTLSVLTRTNMTMHKSYTIDPDGCTDADDAFCIFTENGKMFLAIHIADPTTYIPLSSALWKDICNRVTTKYPSNRPPIHMMPTSILSLASLQTGDLCGAIKKAITVLAEINPETYEIINTIKLLFTEICVRKDTRYTYTEAAKNINVVDAFKHGLCISEVLKTKRKQKLDEVNASYMVFDEDRVYLKMSEKGEKQMKTMIAEFAIFANSFVGEYLKIHLNVGIFRTCNANAWLQNVCQGISGQDLLKEIIVNGIKAEYMHHVAPHDLVGMAEYCHFTSPLRRLADCVCHYLLKYIYLGLPIEAMPFSESELEKIADKCLAVAKQDKKTQYLDTKFRLLQVIHNILLAGECVTLEYYITSYSGLFLNVIISKIATFDVHLSYTLRVKKYKKHIEPKQMHYVKITQVNCFEKFDENTLPELDRQLLCD